MKIELNDPNNIISISIDVGALLQQFAGQALSGLLGAAPAAAPAGSDRQVRTEQVIICGRDVEIVYVGASSTPVGSIWYEAAGAAGTGRPWAAARTNARYPTYHASREQALKAAQGQ